MTAWVFAHLKLINSPQIGTVMMRRSSLSMWGSVTLMALLFSCASLFAQSDWTETFDDGFDQTWEFQGLNPVVGESSSFSATPIGGVLQFSDRLSIASGGAAIGVGAVTTDVFEDVLVAGTLNPTNEFFTSPVLTLVTLSLIHI